MIRDVTSIRGENNPKQKLTEAQVLEIRAITGKLQKEIADIYGISQFTISQIINRVTWKHI
jgi:DNA-directed RNA polymerase specialized sigma subunit